MDHVALRRNDLIPQLPKTKRGCPLRIGLWTVALLAGFVPGIASPHVRADDLDRAAEDLVSKYTVELAELAEWCDVRGLAQEAEQTRKWLHPRDPNKLYVAVLPRKVGRPKLPDDAPAELVEWDGRFTRLRRDQANALYELSRRAIRVGRASLAFDLVLAAIRENPDHAAVRGLLGYQEFQGNWRTVFEVQKLRAGQVRHEQFGWLPKSYVLRYEQDQRYYKGRWITAEEDARLHRDIRSGWDIQTEHYIIRTNHSLQAAVELGNKLERLYRVWKQIFIRYYASESQVTALFDGRSRGRRIQLPRHSVVYFRDRDDYNRFLRSAFPNIAISLGVYWGAMRKVCFFAGEDQDPRTLYHEATHQLFHESRPVPRDVGMRQNFWIIEGIAMYMESLREEDGFHVLGGFDDDRVHAARYRLLKDDFYVPLAEFSTYGMQDVQADKRIATLYSQAAGLTHFLIYYDGGRYRDALVAYLATVYSGRDDPNTLAQLTGVPYSDLDRQYREHMQKGPQQPGRAVEKLGPR